MPPEITGEKKKILGAAMSESLKQIFDEAKIPAKYYLTVAKRLEKVLADHEADRALHHRTLAAHAKELGDAREEIKRSRALARGERGYTPVKGHDYFTKSDIDGVIHHVLKRIKLPKAVRGVDGKPGRDGRDGNDAAVNVEDITKAMVEYLKKEKPLDISHIRNGIQPKQKKIDTSDLRWHGGGNTVLYSDLSSQCNGTNKVFTIPANTSILQVVGTDAPILYRKTTDWTGSGTTTLTLTATVNAPSAGATFGILYVA